MEKKKNSKIKEYWNDKGKSLALRILHIVCYVLSLGFIILCVYACANTNNKDNKYANAKKGLYLEQPRQLTINVDYGLLLSSIDEEWFNTYLINSVTSYLTDNSITLSNFTSADSFEIFGFYNSVVHDSHSFLLHSCIYDSLNNSATIFYYIDSSPVLTVSYTTVNGYPNSFVDYSYDINFSYFLSYLYSNNLYLSYDEVSSIDYYEIYQNYLDFDTDNIFGGVTNSMTDYIDTIGKGLESSAEIFYDEDNSKLTAIGWLSVIVVAVGLTWSVFSIVSGLIRLRG